MGMFDWLGKMFGGKGGGKAMSLYKIGMAKAKKHDHPGALKAYSEAIAQAGAARDVIAMTRYNRALVYAAMGDNASAEADLNFVMSAAEAPGNIKTMAKQKLMRMETRTRIAAK